MIRRSVLAGIVAGGTLAVGCLAGTVSDGPPADATAAVTVEDVDPFAPAHPIEASVEVARPHVTPEHTASVELTLANQSSRVFELRAGDGDWSVLSDRASDPLDPGLALVGDDALGSGKGSESTPGDDEGTSTPPATSRSPRTPEDRSSSHCWKLDDDTANPFKVLNLTRLDPGGTASRTFAVWGHYRNAAETCLPGGVFRFDDTYRFENEWGPDPFEWGFAVRAERHHR